MLLSEFSAVQMGSVWLLLVVWVAGTGCAGCRSLSVEEQLSHSCRVSAPTCNMAAMKVGQSLSLNQQRCLAVAVEQYAASCDRSTEKKGVV